MTSKQIRIHLLKPFDYIFGNIPVELVLNYMCVVDLHITAHRSKIDAIRGVDWLLTGHFWSSYEHFCILL